MALVKGTNSYVDVAEADAYFDNRLGSSVWTSTSPTDKEKALITATKAIDENQWEGSVVDGDQSLSFPRIGEYFDPRLGFIVVFDEVEVPSRIKEAVYEAAIHMLGDTGTLSSSSTVDSITIGEISLTKIRNNQKLSAQARSLILPMLKRNSQTWWRAN